MKKLSFKLSFLVVLMAVFVGSSFGPVHTAHANFFTDFWARIFSYNHASYWRNLNGQPNNPTTTGRDNQMNNVPVKLPPIVSAKAPVINGVSGPTVLEIGTTGTWVVKASDPLKKTLSYSVIWGDEGSRMVTPAANFAPSKVYIQSATFTHAYSRAGTFTPTFIVKNESGFEARTSITVRVGANQPPSKEMPVMVKTDKKIYAPGENILIIVTAINNTGADKTLQFNSGCQTNYMIGSYDSAGNQICTMSLTSVTIPKGESHVWTMNHTPNTFRYGPGTYRVVGRVIGYGEGESSIIVRDDNPNAPITVIEPNGGETWTFGSSEHISWKVPNYQYLNSIRAESYDITLVPYYPPCTTNFCPMYPIQAPFTIAKGVFSNDYSWNVGTILDSGRVLNSGKYQIQICNSNHSLCDMSDGAFSISK